MPWIGVGTRMNLLLQWSAISRPFPTGWPAVGHEEAQIPTSDHPELLLGGCTAIPSANPLSVTHMG